MRVLTDSDVTRLVSVESAALALEEAFTRLARGEATLHERSRSTTPVGKLSTMGGVLAAASPVAAAKVYTTSPGGRFCFTLTLFDPLESRWLATMQAGALTRIRTAATSLIAARRLARSRSAELTVVGAGVQAEAHALAFACGFPLSRIRVVARRPVPDFTRRLSRATELPVVQVEAPEQAVEGADLVVTATRATTPLFRGEALTEGVHITSVGATRPDARELDAETVARADRVVVESRSQARREAGNLVGSGIDWDRVMELAELFSGTPGRRRKLGEITLFDSLGIGLEDAAVADLAYRRAVEEGIGVEVVTSEAQ